MDGSQYALELKAISRRFGLLIANDGINIAIKQGEVHALLGENGAGKSTLMRIVAGIISPDSGEIRVKGEKVDIKSPNDAAQHGIQMVHQHFALIASLTVAENLHLAKARCLREPVALADVRKQLLSLEKDYGIHLDPDAIVEELTIGGQQRLEISRALFLRANLLILDEPTAVLTPSEVEDLFRLLVTLKATGVSIIFISHKLSEVMAIADRVTVLRQGRVVDALDINDATIERLSLAVVGKPVSRGRRASNDKHGGEAAKHGGGEAPALRLSQISTAAERERVQLQDIDLLVRPGEIVGVAGVDGNGQSELIDVVTGIIKPAGGTVHVEPAFPTRPGPMLAHIPDDRGRKGLVLSMTCQDNLLMRHCDDPSLFRFGFIRKNNARKHSRMLLQRFNIRESAAHVTAGSLSGGNQQRLLLARELVGTPRIIVAAQPTRGVDVAGASFIHGVLREFRDRGAGILVVSTELEELLTLSDRIVVMFRGRIMGEVPGNDADPVELGTMMLGRQSNLTAGASAR